MKMSHEFYDSYIILDLETTGLKPSACEIIEVGAIKVVDGQPVEVFETLIRPSGPISPFISRLTGITSEELANAPGLEQVEPWIFDFLEGLPLGGYNTKFDLGFLNFHLSRPVENEAFDVYRFAVKHYPGQPSYALSKLSRNLGLRQSTHRALADCIATMDLYEKIKQECREQNMNGADLFSRQNHPDSRQK